MNNIHISYILVTENATIHSSSVVNPQCDVYYTICLKTNLSP